MLKCCSLLTLCLGARRVQQCGPFGPCAWQFARDGAGGAGTSASPPPEPALIKTRDHDPALKNEGRDDNNAYLRPCLNVSSFFLSTGHTNVSQKKIVQSASTCKCLSAIAHVRHAQVNLSDLHAAVKFARDRPASCRLCSKQC